MEERYRVLEPLGTGGMATVHKAHDQILDRQVAIKRLLPHLANDPQAAQRFRREAQAAAGLSHPGIVTVYDTGSDDAGPYIVMELIEGETLADLISRSGPIHAGATAAIIRSAADALDHAHQNGVIHRDVKPSNLIVDGDGGVRITDFGIARAVEDPSIVTSTQELAGTVTYMAPEIISGEPVTAASDIYSLGVVAFEMLKGHPPYQGETVAALLQQIRAGSPPELGPTVPAEVASGVLAALEKDPTMRPETATALATSLVAGTTIPVGTDVLAASEPGPTGSVNDEPTVLMASAPTDTRPRVKMRGPLVLVAAFAAVLALALLANSLRPDGDDQAAVGTSTTEPALTTSTQQATTSSSVVSTTVPDTSATIALAISELLADMDPPTFKPKDVRDLQEMLVEVLEEATEEDRDELAERFEKALDEVDKLDDSSERDQLRALLLDLAESYGVEISGDDEDDD